MFSFPDGDDTFPFVAAFVFGYSNDGGEEELYGVVLKGKCERDKHKNGVSVGCGGSSGVGGTLRHGQFEMDPALRKASLRVREDGESHRVVWTAHNDDTPGLYGSSEWCFAPGEEEPEGEGHGGGFIQIATARGRAFDRKLESSGRWFDVAQMEAGAMATQCTWLSPSDREALREGRYEDVYFRVTRSS